MTQSAYSLYSPVYGAAKVITANPVILTTAEKNQVLKAFGVQNTQNFVAQDQAFDTEIGRSRLRKWGEKPLSTHIETETGEVIAPGQRALFFALLAAAGLLAIATVWKLTSRKRRRK